MPKRKNDFTQFNECFNASDSRCYVICDANKQRRNSEVYSYQEAKEYLEKGALIGFILPKNIIVMDFDKTVSQYILSLTKWDTNPNDITHSTTPNGMHVWLKSEEEYASDILTMCGISARVYREGKYVILPYGCDDREFVQMDALKGYDFYPMLKPLEYTSRPIFNIPIPTDAYIDTLKRYVQILENEGYDQIGIGVALTWINDKLAEESIPRDVLINSVIGDARDISFMDGNKFDHVKMVDFFIARYPMVVRNDRVFVYFDGVYKEAEKFIENMTVYHHPPIKMAQRKEVIETLRIKVRSKEKKMAMSKNVVNFKNGTVSVEKYGQLNPHLPETVLFQQISANFDSQWQSKEMLDVDRYFKDVTQGDEQLEKFLYQLIGYCLIPNLVWDKAFILWGPTADNGKSTFLKVLTAVVGKDNVSSVSLKQIVDDKFSLVKTNHKLVNLQGETSTAYLEDIAIFKQIVTGDDILVQEKNQPAFMMTPSCKHIFATNEFPKIRDKSNGFYRRVFAVEFKAKFSEEQKAKFSIDNITHQQALDYIASRAIYEYSEVVRTRTWAKSDASDMLVNQIKITSSSVAEFWSKEILEGEHINRPELYTRYQAFCDAEAVKHVTGKKSFYNELRLFYPDEYKEYGSNGQIYIEKVKKEEKKQEEEKNEVLYKLF